MVIVEINVRFFIYDPDYENGIMEVSEGDFKECDGRIEYERHTVFDNGCRQICLTKHRNES